MKFVDEATLIVQSGDGGRGCVSFRRERFIPRGGPDGGNGGKGGDVVLVATRAKHTLYHFRYKHRFQAQRGGYGSGANRHGKNGEDLLIEVPVGTIVRDAETSEIIADLSVEEERCIVCHGGRGGKGNKHFTSSTYRAPRFAQDGEEGEEKTLKLELKLLADVGLVGLPNAGKSSLITALTAARPKIGAYPFTTLAPSLGVLQDPYGEPVVIADIPGLIEGAAQGAGLGHRFLRHIERNRLLIHLIDASQVTAEDPLASYQAINKELSSYDQALGEKPQIVVLNKMDLPEAEEGACLFKQSCGNLQVLQISAILGEGLDELIEAIFAQLREPGRRPS
ncbi:GTP-binding protein Obg/CgtA [Desulfatibacillum aliphaticivorans]|uniref:GTPase Obg n=1 Tax=Desulfatibacillum aliphaticivorans TaxID=218208 RepID=OBG_DESAL|nr:GTPase ObgE [Desulfatibacillum aliphaticivorans]B8FM68.1 RecName: Full=GTPase Obg; AltName: Full=GTP-binding protein Obg [Desulfatibacillum aliphaticivorans]ACL05801.1 GTP-binding protein Obg/CgtA [Desulfatibacillum aliphaticivorans]